MAVEFENTADLDAGITGVLAGVISSLCIVLLIILCASKDKPSKDDIEDEEIEVRVINNTEGFPAENHANGKKINHDHNPDHYVERPVENDNRDSRKKDSKKAEKRQESKKESKKSKKDKEKRSSKISQSSKRRSGHVSRYDDETGEDLEADCVEDEHDYQDLLPQEITFKPIELANLKSYIEEMRKDPHSFRNEYEKLPHGRHLSKSDAVRSGLERKNRFHNILPYNHSRVKLSILSDDPLTDYINACYVDGYNKDKAFIASQGPTPDTVPDFWRMVWEQNSSVIVMVTRLVEAGMQKCHQYWPEKPGQTVKYGLIIVEFRKETFWPDYIVRTFEIKTENSKERIIKQYHFMGWPDHGVPLHATALLNFRRKVKSEIKLAESPCIVHCSAGVGRSGTFIALDHLMDQAEAEMKVDIVGSVGKLREQRCYMVQTLDQYIFVYNAVLEAIMVGETTIPCYQFEERYKQLLEVDDKKNISQLEQQFKILDMMKDPLREEDLSFAKEEQNKTKNRDPLIMPPNRHGVRLMTEIPGRNNYINAAFVDGYTVGMLFIATQMPLSNTAVDFWRMVHDYKCSTIIMLNTVDPEDKNEEPYWPKDDQFISIAPFTIDHVKTESNDDFLMRTLKVTFKKEERTVLHIAVKDKLIVDDSSKPTQSVFFQLFDKLQVLQRSSNIRIPVIVHCLKGVEITGIFVAVCCLCDMINTEQEVDVFRVVKHIRQTRPQFIPTLEQYKYLYETALLYMKQFEDYSNFQ